MLCSILPQLQWLKTTHIHHFCFCGLDIWTGFSCVFALLSHQAAMQMLTGLQFHQMPDWRRINLSAPSSYWRIHFPEAEGFRNLALLNLARDRETETEAKDRDSKAQSVRKTESCITQSHNYRSNLPYSIGCKKGTVSTQLQGEGIT